GCIGVLHFEPVGRAAMEVAKSLRFDRYLQAEFARHGGRRRDRLSRRVCCEYGRRSRTPGSVLSVHASQKHGETALLRPRSAKVTLYECQRALVRLYSHPQMLRPCWPLAG